MNRLQLAQLRRAQTLQGQRQGSPHLPGYSDYPQEFEAREQQQVLNLRGVGGSRPPGTAPQSSSQQQVPTEAAYLGNAVFDPARVNATRLNVAFNNGGALIAGGSFMADYQIPHGKVAIIDQFQFLISPTPPLAAAATSVSVNLQKNGNPEISYQNVIGYPTDPYDCHMVVDQDQHAQVLVVYAFGGASYALVRMYGRLINKQGLPANFESVL